MHNKFIKDMEEKLELDKEETEKTIESLSNRLKNDENIGLAVNQAQVTNHPADIGSELFEKEKDIALVNSQRELTNKINDALDKIEKGSYGKCDICSKSIEPERLEILPYTTSCANCAIENSRDIEPKQDYVSESTLENFYDTYEDMLENGSYQGEEGLITLQDPNYLAPGCVEKVEEVSNEEYRNQI